MCVRSESLDILKDEALIESSERLGELFREMLSPLSEKYPWLLEIQGKGYLNLARFLV